MIDARPRMTRVIATDYAAMVATVFATLGTIAMIANLLFRFADDVATIIAGCGVAIGVPLLIARVRYFNTLFATGHRLPGRVTKVWFFRDRGRVTYTFEFQGGVVTTGNALHKRARTSALHVGMPVTILADTADPRRAIILDLYV